MTPRFKLVLAGYALLALSACDTMNSAMDSSYNGMKSAWHEVNPWSSSPPTPDLPATPAPVAAVPGALPPALPAATATANPADPTSVVNAQPEVTQTPAASATATTAAALAPTVTAPAKTAAEVPGTVAVSDPSGEVCPDVRIVQDLNQVHQFTDPLAPGAEDATSTIRMMGIQDKCTKVKNNMAIDMTVAFEGTIGPKGRSHTGDKPSFSYPYFVAITNPEGAVIAKEVFSVNLSYDGTQTMAAHSEQIRQLIPLGKDDYKKYKVMIGFQLTDPELAYNRALPSAQARPVANPITVVDQDGNNITPTTGQ